MQFASDNTGPAHPAVMSALMAANDGYATPYGGDPAMGRVTAALRDLFEAPQAEVYLVSTGTAANALILACLGEPWQTVFCARAAHIEEDECGAPEFFSAGAKLTLVDGPDGKMAPEALAEAVAAAGARGVHGVQRGPVSITQATEAGTVHSLDEIHALTEIAQAQGLPVHMDGARFANALVRLGCTPAEMTWKVGVDALAFGATKNGCTGVEAVILFDPAKAWEFELRRKRAAHLLSKHRYLSAQMEAYLEDGRWREIAQQANAAADRLAAGLHAVPRVDIAHPVQANMVFAWLPDPIHRHLQAEGAAYYVWGSAPDPAGRVLARLVCDWSATPEATDRFLDLAQAASA